MSKAKRIAAVLILVGVILAAWIWLALLSWDNGILVADHLVNKYGMSLIEALGASALLIAWVVWVLWSVSRIALGAWRGDRNQVGLDYRTYAGGLVAGAVLAVGIILVIKEQLVRFDSFGLGFVLVLVGSILIWAVVRDSSFDNF
jgi:hypothetical protein